MSSRIAGLLVVTASILLSSGAINAQQDARITQALKQFGSKSPETRAKTRKAILDLGAPGIAMLRRAIQADESTPPELLFVIAEDLGRERRSMRFTQRWDLGEKGWQLAWRPGGQQFALLQKYGGPIHIFDSDCKRAGDDIGSDAAKFAFDPTDKTVAYNNGAGELVIAEHASDRKVMLAVTDKPTITYSPDGKHLATGDYGRVVDLWNIATGERIFQFAIEGTKGGLTPVFSPNGKLLVVGNRNDKTHVFETNTGKQLHVLDRAMTQDIAFSPDGTKLAIGYVDGKIAIWNPASGTLQKLFDSETKEVFTLAWSPDGKTLASAGLSGPIVIWSARHLAKLHALTPGSERTFQVAFRPDGRMLIAAGNQTTRAWSIE